MILFLTAGILLPLVAQHQEVNEKPAIWKGGQSETRDTSSLLYAFKKGQLNGHFRYFYMTTDNDRLLTDYYANAAGGGIRFETARFHGFQFGVSGFYIFNLGSSDFSIPDSITGQMNRYEIGLFDHQNPSNKEEIDRLEEFFIKYNFRKSFITFGKQLLNTPFVNLQDGRMRPTGVEGIWLELHEFRQIKVKGGWLYAISPRGTNDWFRIGESIGQYSVGVNSDGIKSGYAGQLKSKGIALLGIEAKVKPWLQWQAWEMLTENIMNTVLVQADVEWPVAPGSKFFAAAQFVRQDALNDGGNAEPGKTYFEKGGKANTFGFKAGWKNRLWETSLNFNRITAAGRYLVPREWGREPFFTFMPRERNEGFGDVTAIMGKVNYQMPKTGLKGGLSLGYYRLPEVLDFRLNKYGMPSYAQLNLDLRYAFKGLLKGLDAQVLLFHKWKKDDIHNNDKYVINKVDMTGYNIILNYHF